MEDVHILGALTEQLYVYFELVDEECGYEGKAPAVILAESRWTLAVAAELVLQSFGGVGLAFDKKTNLALVVTAEVNV